MFFKIFWLALAVNEPKFGFPFFLAVWHFLFEETESIILINFDDIVGEINLNIFIEFDIADVFPLQFFLKFLIFGFKMFVLIWFHLMKLEADFFLNPLRAVPILDHLAEIVIYFTQDRRSRFA